MIDLDLAVSSLALLGGTAICDGMGASIWTSGYASYNWSNGNTDSISFFTTAGRYSLTVTDELGCKEMIDFNISDNRDRKVAIQLSQEVVFVGQSIQLGLILESFSMDQLADISWTSSASDLDCTNCERPTTQLSEATIIRVQVVDQDGCIHSNELSIEPLLAYKEIYTGNTFSPNGDGVNDQFILQSVPGVVYIEDFKVYNRWGNLMHSASQFIIDNRTGGWDGQYKGSLASADSYTWIADVQYADGSNTTLTGTIQLVR
jgi:gliding motility-associated-like protein